MKTRTNQPVVANSTPTGEIDKVLGISADGKIVKGAVSGGTQLWKHSFKIEKSNGTRYNVTAILTTNEKMIIQGGPPRLKTSGIIVQMVIGESTIVVLNSYQSLVDAFPLIQGSSTTIGSGYGINSGTILDTDAYPYNVTAI